MRKKITLIMVIVSMLTLNSCITISDENKAKAIEAALRLIDKMQVEGRIGEKNAEDLRKVLEEQD